MPTHTQPQPTPLPEPIFWRIADVGAYLRVSKSTLYRMLKRVPDFPRPYRLSGTVLSWRRAEVEEWAASRVPVERAGP